MVYRECTRHNWCSLRKVSKAGEVKSALPDLNGLPLALVLIMSARSLPLRLSRLGAHLGKVIRTPASEAAVIIIRASGWLCMRPRAVLLLRRCKSSLLRKPESSLLLLLGRSNNPTPWLRGLLRECGWAILHNTIPRCRGTRGSSRCLALLFSAVCRNKILLRDSHIHQFIERVCTDKI